MKDTHLRFRKKPKYKNYMYAFLCVCLVFISSGIAFIRSSLGINGSTAVGTSWDIHFENLEVAEESMEAIVPATIDSLDTTKINFKLNFDDYRDYYEFEVDIVNNGTIDAEVAGIDLSGISNEAKPYMEYDLLYTTGERIKEEDELLVGDKKRICFYLRFNDKLNLSYLFKQEDLSFDLSFNIEFIQNYDYTTFNNVDRTATILGRKMVAYLANAKSEFVTSSISYSSAPSNTNGKGLYIEAGTEDDEYPIFFFRGNVLNNNVLFADKCWKIVRTTETGGTKLLYNGIPNYNNSDGICANTGNDVLIGSGPYNNTYNSPASGGYMYSSSASKYYTNSKNSMDSTGKLEPILIDVDSDKYINISNDENYLYNLDVLTGYWTSSNHSTGSISNFSFNVATAGDYYLKYLVNTNNYNDYATIYVNDEEIGYHINWNSNGELYLGNLDTSDLITITYTKESSSTSSSDGISFKLRIPSGEVIDNRWLYGNSVTYEDGMYTLVDVKPITWGENISNYHYTCFSTNNTCSSVNYITNVSHDDENNISYIRLMEGDMIDDVLDKVLPNSNLKNEVDSTVKHQLDTWFISSVGLKNYSEYLEDAVWCNNRKIISIGGWKPNGGLITTELNFEKRISGSINTKCENIYDRFTLKSTVTTNNSNLNGNQMLDYPIGLLTLDEIKMIGVNQNSYAYAGVDYWTMTPAALYLQSFNTWYVNGEEATNKLTYTSAYAGYRPAISLKQGITASWGDGTVSNPFVVDD